MPQLILKRGKITPTVAASDMTIKALAEPERRTLHKLTAAKVAALIKANAQGRAGDGDGLYLQIVGGSASWLFRYIRDGRERQIGLGPARDVTLAQARHKAHAQRSTLPKPSRGNGPPSTVGPSDILNS